MMSRSLLWFVNIVLFGGGTLGSACVEQPSVPGDEGKSCDSDADCSEGLVCIPEYADDSGNPYLSEFVETCRVSCSSNIDCDYSGESEGAVCSDDVWEDLRVAFCLWDWIK